ncbi:MAG: phosphonate ABC transporter ATP-binding protein [Euryarchaeota archaeon]|nr:phosphonate ABC transporter ATP-binding protein [Euryarchaeota archaeon]MCG2737356.1 phosphonate ABC transporter ATP-binding protein [Candidatus Methanoperedenaceae archaeon]
MIHIENLTKIYGSCRAVDNISVDVKRGEFIGVLGASGAGKTTFLRCINRLVEPTSGRINLNGGKDVMKCGSKELLDVRKKVGMIFQQFGLLKRLSVLDNVLTGKLGYTSPWTALCGFNDEHIEEAYKALESVELEDKAPERASNLSGGQQQRVAIARVLVQNPEIVLADEPVASLDPYSANTVMKYLKKINKERGITILSTLHQVDYATTYTDRIMGMSKGRVIFDGSSSAVKDDVVERIYGVKHQTYCGEAQVECLC